MNKLDIAGRPLSLANSTLFNCNEMNETNRHFHQMRLPGRIYMRLRRLAAGVQGKGSGAGLTRKMGIQG